jgi:putative transposase
MRELIAARDWPHVIRLPAYAPDFNPVEQVWSQVKRVWATCWCGGIDELVAVVKSRLKRIQCRPKPIDALPARTGHRNASRSTPVVGHMPRSVRDW